MSTITHQHDGLERIANGIAALVFATRSAYRAVCQGTGSLLRSWEALQQSRADARTVQILADLAKTDPGMLADYRAAVLRSEWNGR